MSATPASGLVSPTGAGAPLRLSLPCCRGLRPPRGVLPTTARLAAPGRRAGAVRTFWSCVGKRPEVTRFGGAWKDETGHSGRLFTKLARQEAGARARSGARL